MALSTIGDIVALALKTAGVVAVGQTALAEDSNDALNLLNAMLSQWQQRRWLVYHLVDSYVQATGTNGYTVGIGGQFNTMRPSRIEAAYARLNPGPGGQPAFNSYDFPVTVIQAREDYAKIQVKGLESFPNALFYDASYPMGTVYFWPDPLPTYELHIITKQALPQFTVLKQTLNLPPEYYEAMLWNLVSRLRAVYQMPSDPGIEQKATASIATLRVANVEIPMLSIPRLLQQGGTYNILTDQTV